MIRSQMTIVMFVAIIFVVIVAAAVGNGHSYRGAT